MCCVFGARVGFFGLGFVGGGVFGGAGWGVNNWKLDERGEREGRGIEGKTYLLWERCPDCSFFEAITKDV